MKNLIHKLDDPSCFKKILFVVFGLCLAYWTYLFFYSKMIVAFDAANYEALGRKIYHDGWVAYFKQGPNREPLYSAFIALSLFLGDFFSVNFQYIQKIIQILFLLSTQGLMLILMNKLRVAKPWQLAAILYAGFSPALITATFSLFSEIIALPFALFIVIVNDASRESIRQNKKKKTLALAVCMGTLFSLAALAKGIFMYLFFIFMAVYTIQLLYFILRSRKTAAVNMFLSLLITSLTFGFLIGGYMSLNKKYNGKFELTNRYADLFAANAHKRTEPASPRAWLSQLAFIPGEGVCRKFFTAQECFRCSFLQADALVPTIHAQVVSAKENEKNTQMMRYAFKRIIERPFQYSLFLGIESSRMLFWESTQIGFVRYPPTLQKLFAAGWFKNGLRFLISAITLLSLLSVLIFVLKNWRRLFDPSEKNSDVEILFDILLLLLTFTFLYAFYSILSRYSFPIAPLYLVSIAYSLTHAFFLKGRIKKKQTSEGREN